MNAGEYIRKPVIKLGYPEILDWFLFKTGDKKSHFFFIYKAENGELRSFVENEYKELLEDKEEQMINEEGKIEYVPQ